MKNKIIFLIIIVIVVGIMEIYFLQKLNESIESSNFQDIVFFSLVKGCAETDKGMATKLINETEQEPKIEVYGNEILYSRAIKHLCCRKVEIEKEIAKPVINIYEVWSGNGCRCICFSEIQAKLQIVPSGFYVINVYEKGTQPESGEPMNQTTIISQNIIIQ
ncbi:MAG: hypothetical protein QXD48_01900 [Candidatus Aenigmatarchaeota archaeon]